MEERLLLTTGRCTRCNGIVKNTDHKRHSAERLTKIHAATCPGIHRAK